MNFFLYHDFTRPTRLTIDFFSMWPVPSNGFDISGFMIHAVVVAFM